jgi:alpha-tubulin suppressor-like RCC1 family protein
VAVWGGNYYGQTNIPANLSNVVAIAAGDYHSLALRGDGTVVAWGDNAFGESAVPAALSNVVAVAGGTFFSMVIQSNGTIRAWGDYSEGQTNVPAGLPYAVASAGGNYHGVAIVGDGSPFLSRQPASQVVFSGTTARFYAEATGIPPLYYQWQFYGTNLPGATGQPLMITNAQSGDAGDYTVVVTNSFGTLTSVKATLGVVTSRPIIVQQTGGGAAWLGTNVIFGVTAIGSQPMTYQWQFNGTNIIGATNSSLTLVNISLNDFGLYTVVLSNAFGTTTSTGIDLIRMASRVIAWGNNNSGQTNVPAGLFNVSAVSAGDSHNLALKDDGTLVAWGDNHYGEATVPAGLSNVVAIAAGDGFSTVLKGDGTVFSWGYGQTNVSPHLNNVVAIAAGDVHNIALKADGTVAAWGINSDGETNVPPGLSNVVAIAAGGFHCLALRADGTLAAWGNNLSGQTIIPPGLTNISAIAAGGYFNLALRSNGTVVAWGYNTDGETNVPPGLANVVSIAAGFYHALAIEADGKMVAWGFNGYGQTNIPLVATNAVAIGGGRYHCLALLHDPSPFFRKHPASQWLYAGSTARFEADVTGATPLVYQWRFRGADIALATTDTLALADVTAGAVGKYSLRASNPYGTAVSHDASLTLFGPVLTGPSFGLPAAQGGFSCLVESLSGHGPVIVYASSNLLVWSPIFTNSTTSGTLQFFDFSATNRSKRFYRAEEQ